MAYRLVIENIPYLRDLKWIKYTKKKKTSTRYIRRRNGFSIK